MTTLALVIVSLVFVRKVPISLLPDIPIPQMTVQISAPDLDARTLENTVTRTVRNQLLQVNNLRDIKSRTRNGNAVLELTLEYGVNTGLSFIEINEKMDQIMHLLPRDLERPRVIKTNVSDIPVFYLNMTPQDPQRTSMLELSEFAEKVIRRRLEQLEEIAFVDMHGLAFPEVIVRPKMESLSVLGLTEEDLARAIRDANLELGTVLIQDGAYQYSIRMSSRLVDIEDIERLYVRLKDRLIRLDELADVQLEERDRRGSFFSNDHRAISLAVRKKSTANNFALSRQMAVLLEAFRQDYPLVDFRISNDQSLILQSSLTSLRTSLLYGLSFASLILFFFFRSWRLPVLIILVVPISLVITLLCFYLTGLSINIVSLTGLILGIGLMIDNSIIIIENIQQKLRTMNRHNAAAEGANEVIKPLISSALTTSSVFLPLILISGLAGALFFDQAISITIALFVSIAVSYFLLPVLARLFLKTPGQTAHRSQPNWHGTLIAAVVRSRYWLCPLFIVMGIGIIWPFRMLDKQSFPNISRQAYSISVDWNEQISLEENEQRGLALYSRIHKDVREMSAFTGELQFLLTQSAQDINEVEYLLFGDSTDFDSILPNVNTWFETRYPFAVTEIKPVENVFDRIFSRDIYAVRVLIQSTQSLSLPEYSEVDDLISNLRDLLPGVKPPPIDEYIALEIDQEKLLIHRMSHEAVLAKLRSVLRSNEVSELRNSDRFIPIQVSSRSTNELTTSLQTQFVKNPDGQDISLDEFVTYRVLRGYKNITAGRSGENIQLGALSYRDGMEEEIRQRLTSDGKYSVQFAGNYYENQQIFGELMKIALVVLALLFLILAAQFESLIQPVIVALTLPIGVLGALLALYVAGESLNIMALVGIIIMSGIDVNDAILKIDMINQNRKRSMPLMEAIIDGSERRIRPIVMTSLTTILAMLPILFSSGLGAELQRPLAVAVIGGLVFGTLASIIMVPMLYRLFAHATAN